MFELTILGLSIACLVITIKNYKDYYALIAKHSKLKLDYAVLKTKYKHLKEGK